MKQPYKIVITGAESTGKSTLSEKLAKHYQSYWIPEYSREYIGNLGRKYTYEDIETIARHQIKREQEIVSNEIVFFDTWLIITKVWFDFVYHKHPEWLHKAILESNIDLFLICAIDMPWIEDPLRENGGLNREKLHNIYLKELQEYNFNFELIKGAGDQRLLNAIHAIDKQIEGI